MILLKRYSHWGSTILDLVIASISPKAGGWMKTFFVAVLTIGSGIRTQSNYLVVLGEEPSPVSGSFSFGALNEHLMVGFLGDIILAT
jgi:hypothetical protein